MKKYYFLYMFIIFFNRGTRGRVPLKKNTLMQEHALSRL